MALVKLSQVTATLMALLDKNLKERFGALTFAVVPQSPDKVPTTITKPTLSVFLYHAQEDPHYRNAEGPGHTVANTPLALVLYYVVTAHRYDNNDEQTPDTPEEQDYLGYALKTLHDYPVITAATKIGTEYVMHDTMRASGDNALHIVYRPLTPEDAATFWNGDDTRLMRFSAFYEVRVVMMMPEEPTKLPGFVLSVGNYVLPTGVMSIVASEGVVRFTPPGGDTVTLIASPARVALSTDGPPGGPPNNQLTLRGTRLGGGHLVLRSPLFTTPGNTIEVIPAKNPDWAISVTPGRLVANITGTLVGPDMLPQSILPGIYGASVQVSTTYSLPGGLTKTLVTRSNEVAIAITPFIVWNSLLGPFPGHVEIYTSEFFLTAPELDKEISVVVDGHVYTSVPSLADLVEPYQFFVTDGNIVTIYPPFTNAVAGVYPVRLIVRGTEAPPYWIVVTVP
jgi:hypothetical protein